MPITFLHPKRHTRLVLMLAALLTGGWTAQAQTPTPSTAAAWPGAVAPGGAGQAALAPLAPLAPPVMTARPDLGAVDMQRSALAAPSSSTLWPAALPRAAKPQSPSQFQRFVQEATGKLLPNFGAQLFENPMAYAADAAAPAPGEYVLGPGDEVRIQIWGAVDYAGNQTLDRNGQISLPKIGVIPLNGVQVKDLDSALRKQVANGLPIHNPKALEEVLAQHAVSTVLLALPSVSRQRRNDILKSLSAYKVAVRTLPGLSDIATGKVSLSDVRELDIDDLLGRETVQPNGLLLNMNTRGKTVLVTGAGGSIGSELCRQIVRTQPRQLLLVEMSEFALYQIHQELESAETEGIEVVPLLASVCDEVRMHEIMDTWKPHTVYHAAAYKHVPLVEHNPAEGVRNNVWGTRTCAEAAMQHGVRNFVLVSTDKAVRPTNIMGATKRLAELVLQALADKSKTTFSMVRFGNVLGSSGSVVPLFREQIKNGGPITLTHADITRYFMTIPEAAQLVIQAGAMGTGGDVFVLDMGEPVKIIDLAKRMLELSGLTVRDEMDPEGDIELTVTGLRPGEKLYEELLIGDNPKPTQHARIMKAHEQFVPWTVLEQKLNALGMAVSVNDVPVIRGLLQDLVSGYQPSGEVVDWVHLAQETADQARNIQ